jgi:hypothetical protein
LDEIRALQYDSARKYLQKSIEDIFQKAKTGFGEACDKTMKALGRTTNDLVGRINTTHIIDGFSSNDVTAGLSSIGNFLSGVLNVLPLQTVAQAFAQNPFGLSGMASIGGDRIYINSGNVLSSSMTLNGALLFHELLHNTGLGDAAIQEKLGLDVDPTNTHNISTRIEDDCFKKTP